MLGFLKNMFGGPQGYTTLEDEEFQEALKTTDRKMIIDVRSRHEFVDYKLSNALNLDIMHPDFKDKISHYDKDKTYFVYCQSGKRSAKACKIMVSQGFEKVYNLKGGINNWTGRTV
ncbi:rhodanese-like domain-containing protein [Rapidithrix thailandica]